MGDSSKSIYIDYYKPLFLQLHKNVALYSEFTDAAACPGSELQ